MRYFKNFFKQTWRPQEMENPSRFESTKATGLRNIGETELHEVKTIVTTASVATSTREQTSSIPCKNGGCKNWTSHGTPESPWHRLKTIFLVSVIVALVLWVIVYALLAQYQIL